MGSFSFSDEDADIVITRNAVFRLVTAKAEPHLDRPDDREEFEADRAMGEMVLDRRSVEEKIRVATALLAGVRQLQQEIADSVELEEPVLPGIDEKLDELANLFQRHLGTPANDPTNLASKPDRIRDEG